MPANGESRGDAHSPVGVSITFQRDVNWIPFSLLDPSSPVSFFHPPSLFTLPPSIVVHAPLPSDGRLLYSEFILRCLIAVLRFFCWHADNARHVELQRETWLGNKA